MNKEHIELPQQEDEREEVQDELAGRVLENFRIAASYRSTKRIMDKSIDRWLHLLHNAYHKIHEAEELASRQNMTIYFGLIQRKVNNTTAYMNTKFNDVEKPPFNLKPTPIVELPQSKSEMGLEKVRAKLLNRLIESGLPPEAMLGSDGFLIPQAASFVKNLAKESREELLNEEMAIAQEATEKMVRLISDQLVDGQFHRAMGEALFDLALYPYCVISYDNESVTDHIWQKNKLVKQTIVRPTFRRVHPNNAYFAPDCTNAQDGAFFIELLQRSRFQLASFIGNEELGYQDEALKWIVENGESDWISHAVELESDLALETNADSLTVLRCQMLVMGAELIDYGINIADSDRFQYFNADIEVCCGMVIRVSIVPSPNGDRTYFSVSYQRIAGEPFGVSIGMMIYDRQLAINRTQYSMELNKHYAAGPMLEVNADAFDNPSEVNFIPLSRVFSNTNRENPNGRGITQHKIQLTFPQLFTQLQNEIRLADDECGLPSFLNGNAGLQGAGQTLGGLAMMTDNAVMGLESCAANIDEFFIRPSMTVMYYRNLQSNDDSVKADAKVVPTGLMGLKNDLMRAKELAGLVPQVGQVAQTGAVPPEVYQQLVRDWLKSNGLNIDNLQSGGQSLQVNTMQSPTAGYVDNRSFN